MAITSKTVHVLCIPFNARGHVNPLLALTSCLKSRNHVVTFAIRRQWEGHFSKLGFKEEVFDEVIIEGMEGMWTETMKLLEDVYGLDPIDCIENLAKTYDTGFIEVMAHNSIIKSIIDKVQPDLILYENVYWHPAVVTAKVPVVHFMPGNPLIVLEGGDLVPAFCGLPLDIDKETLIEHRKRKEEAFEKQLAVYKEAMKSLGAVVPKAKTFHYVSSNLNIYLYPKRLAEDYIKRSLTGHHWIGIDHAIRPIENNYKIPDDFKALPGKTVFVSMGTLGSMTLDLMNKLVKILSKGAPKYKFIVSKGVNGDQYELAENMIGENYLPQLGVLQLVDLAIIHAGNNSFTETLYFGKPMILIPLFFDQFDNAQRAVDAKVGARFNPFKQTGDELLNLMDEVMANDEILKNVKQISKEMQSSTSLEEAVDKIVQVALNPKKPYFVECE